MSASTLIDAAVIIPWRDKGDRARKRNLDAVTKHLDGCLPDIPTCVIGDGRTGPFNRSAAYNHALSYVKADVYVFHEADMIVDPDALRTAIRLAGDAPGLVVPFDVYHYLSRDATKAVVDGKIEPQELAAERRMADGRSVGAVNVVSATTMKAIGCWDETFAGWGYDDRAMALAFQVATGAPTRFVSGLGIHLWHTPGWQAGGRFAGGTRQVSAVEQAATDANAARYRRYKAARTPDDIRLLTSGR